MRAHQVARTLLALLLCTAALAPAGRAAAQTTTGALRGYVRGEGGQEVAGAAVTARNTETNQVRRATSDANGFYAIPGLRPGTYEVAVAMMGLAGQRRTIQVLVGQTLDLNWDLTTQAVALEGIDRGVERLAPGGGGAEVRPDGARPLQRQLAHRLGDLARALVQRAQQLQLGALQRVRAHGDVGHDRSWPGSRCPPRSRRMGVCWWVRRGASGSPPTRARVKSGRCGTSSTPAAHGWVRWTCPRVCGSPPSAAEWW